MKSAAFTVTIRATSITISPGNASVELLHPLLSLFEYYNEFTEESHILGYMLDTDTDILYIHKGVELSYLQRLLGNVIFVKDEYDKCDPMRFEYEEIISPRNEDQQDVIDFIAGTKGHIQNIDARQLFLVKQPGFG